MQQDTIETVKQIDEQELQAITGGGGTCSPCKLRKAYQDFNLDMAKYYNRLAQNEKKRIQKSNSLVETTNCQKELNVNQSKAKGHQDDADGFAGRIRNCVCDK